MSHLLAEDRMSASPTISAAEIARGIQHYGFLPMNLPPEIDLPGLVHGANERVPLSAIDFGAEAIYRLLRLY